MNHSKHLRHQVVVITGASAGIGRATAILFAKYGARIALLARGVERLEATKKEVESLRGSAQIYPVDISDAAKLEQVTDQIESELGPISIWINNAMCSVFGPFTHIDPKDYSRVTDVTYHGQVYGTMNALKKMKSRDKGTIVLVGSALAYRGIPLQAAYCAAKHAIEGFFQSLRCELMHENSNIHLTTVHLPAINTPQFEWAKCLMPNQPKPMGKIYQPEVAAEAILYAATHKRRELFVGFSTYLTIFANKWIPWYLDKHLAKNGYNGQQTQEKVKKTREDNLWNPVKGGQGAHGTFDDIAKTHSFALKLTMHRKSIGTIIIILIFAVLYFLL